MILANDDMLIRTPHWDQIIKHAFSKFPDDVALAYANDLYYGKKMSTFPVLPRTSCELMENICPSVYWRHCIDAHVFDVFEKLAALGFERRLYLNHVVFEHMHLSVEAPIASNDLEDQKRFVNLNQERETTARRLARHIQSQSTSLDPSSNTADFSLMVYSQDLQPDSLKFQRLLENLSEQVQALGSSTEVVFITSEALKNQVSIPKSFSPRWVIHQNTSVASLLNQEAKQAKGKFLLFLDATSEPEATWLSSLENDIHQNPKAVLGSLWLHPRTGKTESAGIVFSKKNSQWYLSRLYQGLKKDNSAIYKKRNLQALEMTGLAISKELFLSVGGLDETLKGFEAMDLCFKLQGKAAGISLSQKACLYHEIAFEQREAIKQNWPLFLTRWSSVIQSDLEKVLELDQFQGLNTIHAH
jgi:hypothetical protein